MSVFSFRSLIVTGAVTGAVAVAQYFGVPFSLTQNGPRDTQRNEPAALVQETGADKILDESPLAGDPRIPGEAGSSPMFGVGSAHAAVLNPNRSPRSSASRGRGESSSASRSASMKPTCGKLLGCGAIIGSLVVGPVSARAQPDMTSELANAICAAPNTDAVVAAVASFDTLTPEDVAEAFGIAAFLGDLGRCSNQQAMADSFAFYKKGKDPAPLDAAFASGRVAAKPEGGTASAEIYQGSFAALGTAGDPPSGQ